PEPLGFKMFFAAGSNITPRIYSMYVMDSNPMKDGSSGGSWIPPFPPPFGDTLFTIAARARKRSDIVLGPKLDADDCSAPPPPPRLVGPTCQMFAKALAGCQ